MKNKDEKTASIRKVRLPRANKEGLHFGQGVKQTLNIAVKDFLFHSRSISGQSKPLENRS